MLYLDPGSGSMLLAGIVGILATILFFLKGFFYKARRLAFGLVGKTTTDHQTKHQLVFYSEGRQYWSTFRPLIDELVRRNERCLYLTSDERDPGLLYSSELLSTRYIGSGTKAYAYLAVLEADVCAMTTPGLDVLQIKRSKGVKHYAYLIHAPTDVGTYKQHSFDYFDSILLSGDHQSRSLRKLEELRGTPHKHLSKVGCLYYDEMKRQLNELDSAPVTGSPTVLVAPTWGENGLLRRFGSRILLPLLKKQWKVILRPHPQSSISEKDMLDRLREELRSYSNLLWDHDNDGTQAMARAHVMVSDLSGIAFDFVFLFERPVITLRFDVNKIGLEASDIPWDLWELAILDTIGTRIEVDQVDGLPTVIEQELANSDRREKIRRVRDESVANFGRAALHIADELTRIRDEFRTKETAQSGQSRIAATVR
jgi:CDP-glycerol:poly(glycerophosphate) glycerophosphotransferase